jgi:CubicO group peptidase (beta-lactamase class C family)
MNADDAVASPERPTGELQEKAQALADLAVRDGLQGALQFCAFKDGKCVIDVWAGTMATDPGAAKIDGRTLFPIFSTEKPLLSTAVHRSVERGRLEYDRRVSDYWPEFRGGGKERLTVRELLGYRSGLPDNKPGLGFDIKSIATQADWKGMLDWYASCEPEIEPGTKQRYMPKSYGWALGGLLEKAWGRPANDLLRELVLRPAGIADDFFFVCGDAEIGRIATVYKSEPFETMNDDLARRSLLPSAWAVSSAKGIAQFYNRLCGFDGQPPLVTRETLDEALKPCRHASDPLPDAEGLKEWHMIFGMGYGLWGGADDLSRVFGHGGVGGSEGLCDRSQRLTVGYTCNFDNAPPKLREAFYSLVGMRWRYWNEDVNIQDLQMAAKG